MEHSNTDNYLQQIISLSKILSKSTPNCILGVKNLDSEHLYISPYLLKILNISLDENHKISIWPHYSLESTCHDDQEIIRKRTSKNFLIFCDIENLILPIMFVKTPIINPHANEVIGLIYQGFPYEYFDLHQHIYSFFTQVHSEQQEKRDQIPIHLSNRQKQVIFYFMANFGSQEIANRLSLVAQRKITKSTVDSIFEQLYIKFDVVNRTQLYNQLIKIGLDKIIPCSLLQPSVASGSSFLVI